MGSLVIAVLGSWHKIASFIDYLVTILNFLGFIASQSKKKILRQWKLIHHESRSEELQQRIIACTVHWYCSSQWCVLMISRPMNTHSKLCIPKIDKPKFKAVYSPRYSKAVNINGLEFFSKVKENKHKMSPS